MPDSSSPFHRGERAIHARLGIAERMEALGTRMIQDHLPETQRDMLPGLSPIFAAAADSRGRPWASALSGAPGFVRAVDDRTLGIAARPLPGDPLGKTLADGAAVGLLALDFETRRRLRVNGRLSDVSGDQLQIRVSQAYPNCPGFIQARRPRPGGRPGVPGSERPVLRGSTLSDPQAAMLARSDTLFIASQYTEERQDRTHGLDVSHRGGRPGFVIVAHESLLLVPDYSGNCMFNTIGNLEADPRCGMLFIDFETGTTLQVSGEAEVLWTPAHIRRFPGAERVLAVNVIETVQIERALPLEWDFLGYSPDLEHLDKEPELSGPLPSPDVMALRSVNVSGPQEIVHDGKTVTTGIFKKPVAGRVRLHRLNLEGDGQADRWGHGGAFRAVYAYPYEHYAYWSRELGRDDFEAGQFGENFTVEGMLETDVHVGDVFRVGSAVVEVSQPRVPCYKLSIRMGIEGFQNRFLQSGRVGFYFRVLREGEVGTGDRLKLLSRPPGAISVHQVNRLLYFETEDLDGAAGALAIPALSHGWKSSFEERLAKVAETEAGTARRRLTVSRKVRESDSITSFYLTPDEGAALEEFLPGQFLTFWFDAPGRTEPVVRTYSLSDRPGAGYYRISVKREGPPSEHPDLPPGLSSNFLHDQVEVGTKLWVGPPRGKFHLDTESRRSVVLLSAGVGLTPMVSMLNTIVALGEQRPVWFIHGARDGRVHAMGDHVRHLAAENDTVHAHIRYSRPSPEDIANGRCDSSGHVDIGLLRHILPFDDYDFYLCGPAPFMKALYCGLTAVNVAEDRIHYEFFGPATVLKNRDTDGRKVPVPPTEDAGAAFEVVFSRSGVSARWSPDCESLLELAERSGLNPPYSCRSGICQTCLSPVTEGEVSYLEQPLQEPKAGCALICCSRPRSNLVIDI